MNPSILFTPDVAYYCSKTDFSLPLTKWTSPAEAFQARSITQGNFVVLCTAGKLEFRVDDTVHSVTAGDVVVVNAGRALTLLSSEEFRGEFIEIGSPSAAKRTVDYSLYDPRFLQFVDLVKKYHYTYIQFYSRQLDLQPGELNTYCQHNSGMLPREWMYGYILLEAKDLLREGLSVSATAKHLGFSQVSHFSAWFSRHAKMSPYAWKHGFSFRRQLKDMSMPFRSQD